MVNKDLTAPFYLPDICLGVQGLMEEQARQGCSKAGMKWMLLLQHRPAVSDQS